MFDWTKVEGYRDDMSADEKLALLENYEPALHDEPKPNDDIEKPMPMPTRASDSKMKVQLDKALSEVSSLKKQLRSRMTDDERREAERVAEQDAMRAELENLRREKTLSNYKASYLAQGYEENLASEAALAMVDGDSETLFDVMSKHTLNLEKVLRAKILQETPKPPASENPEEEKRKRRVENIRKAMGLPPL